MKFLMTTLAIALFVGINANAQEKSRIALSCQAIEINASEYEEAFSVEEYPDVEVEAIDKSNPVLPSIMEEFNVSIGSNRALRAGQDGVKLIRNESEGQGHQKYVVKFTSGKTITVETDGSGRGALTSSDGSLDAVLRCSR